VKLRDFIPFLPLCRKGGKLVSRLVTRLLLRYLLKFLRIVLWDMPVKIYGAWVVIGAYGTVLALIDYWLGLLDVTDLLWCAGLYVFVARWRWNWVKFHRGIRPLYERRDDI
jgi:hypothetical protein